MADIFPPHLSDYYKVSHRQMYPPGTEVIYSNLTPRSSRLQGVEHVVFFGLQYFIKEYLLGLFQHNFFGLHDTLFDRALAGYKRRLDTSLGGDNDVAHWRSLRDLGYLPLEIKALPEGALIPLRVPVLSMKNTLPEFFWLGQWMETLLSTVIWKPITTATIAYQYRLLLDKYASQTSDMSEFVDFQGHDFSFRGMSSVEDAMAGGAGHILSFKGTDTIPAVDFLERYYSANAEKELIAGSIVASEHSTMTVNGEAGEFETFRRLLTEVYPEGNISLVSDSYNLWRVLTDYLPRLRDVILNRKGKLVVRPDSGNPVDIIVGKCINDRNTIITPEHQGVVELLYETFGGTTNSKGCIQLHPNVGVIYGDSITLDRCKAICEGLSQRGYASTNVVFGIGSYCVSPDTLILCADLIWRKAGEIEEGQEIIAFDEDPIFEEGKHATRTYKKANIIFNQKAKKQCYKIYTDIGDPIIASIDHPWLVYAKNRHISNVFYVTPDIDYKKIPRSAGLIWKQSQNLSIGDEIAFIGKPWECENTREAGWLAGMFDGEGSISYQWKARSIPAWKVCISQNEGEILNRLRKGMYDRNFDFYENVRSCPQLVIKGGWTEFLRFMGTIRPQRLLTKMYKIVDNMPALKNNYTYKRANVTKIEFIGEHQVSSIRTSSGTFITEGYLSHNTYQYVTRDTFGLAFKATAIKRNGQWNAIYKDPVTDTGMKRSARGLLKVIENNGEYILVENVSENEEQSTGNALEVVFRDGKLLRETSLSEIRNKIAHSR